MPAKPQILFVSHDACLTGAPNSLLNFLDWGAAQGKFDFRVLLLDGGDLEEKFVQRGPTALIRREERGLRHLLARIWAKAQGALGRAPATSTRWAPSRAEQRRVNACLKTFKPDLIYLNSVAAAPALACLTAVNAPVLTFLRELEEYVEKTRATGWLVPLVERTQAFISVSEAAKRHFIEQFQLPPERCTVINTFINTHKLQATSKAEARLALLARAGNPPAAFIVVGCGTTDWRKGPDLFLSIARSYFETNREDQTVFIWIGGLHTAAERLQIAHDIDQGGMAGRVCFIGEQANAAQLLPGADVLALTSREDPFPRVVLEAALGRCPVVAFANSGGAEEFTRKGGGSAVPYLSISGFVATLHQLRHDEAFRAKLGETAFKTVLRDHDVQVGSQRIYAVIETLLTLNPATLEQPQTRVNAIPEPAHRPSGT